MKNDGRRTRLEFAMALWLLAPAVTAAPSGSVSLAGIQPIAGSGGMETENPPLDQTRDSIIQQWPERSRMIVRAITEKYGIPNRINLLEVVWYNNGPWRRTVVHRNSWSGFLGVRDNDYLEQTIGYRVPDDKVSDIKRFGKRIDVDKNYGELSSRAETESMNFLALNLAGEIAAGKWSAKGARDFYSKTEEFSKSGKTSPYLEGFVFPIGSDKAAAP